MSNLLRTEKEMSQAIPPRWVRNAQALPRSEVPFVSVEGFVSTCQELCAQGGRLAALFALPAQAASTGTLELLAVLADDVRGRLGLLRTAPAADGRYPALTPRLPQAQAFERELAEAHGLVPEAHPWLKPLRRHAELERSGSHAPAAVYPFFRVEGSGLHEVAVGPIHAGVIEPGHFRFQCHGETVLNLEVQLGFQHRGALELLCKAPPARRLAVAESIAGDTVIGHGLAYCWGQEALAGVEVPLYAQALRGIALELERLSNHVGDLGGLCNDVGYLPGASWFGRLRGELLNLLMELSGNRFGRSLLKPGGVRFGLTAQQRKDFLARLARAERDLNDTAAATFDSASVCSRFEQTGVVTRQVADQLGLVGPVARASGADRDARRDHAAGLYRFAYVPVARVESGDVMARALVRWLEVQRSLTFVREQIAELPAPSLAATVGPARPDHLVVCLAEGWRGEILHLAVSSADGAPLAYRVVDPSFHNWFGLVIALRGNAISDFPLCNKSFNLSYAGHDL